MVQYYVQTIILSSTVKVTYKTTLLYYSQLALELGLLMVQYYVQTIILSSTVKVTYKTTLLYYSQLAAYEKNYRSFTYFFFTWLCSEICSEICSESAISNHTETTSLFILWPRARGGRCRQVLLPGYNH